MPTYRNKPEVIVIDYKRYLRSDVVMRKYGYTRGWVSTVSKQISSRKINGVLYLRETEVDRLISERQEPTESDMVREWWKSVPLERRKKLRTFDHLRREMKKVGLSVSRHVLYETMTKLGWKTTYDYRLLLRMYLEDARWYATPARELRREFHRRHGFLVGHNVIHRARRAYEKMIPVERPDPCEWVTTREAMALRGVSVATVNAWARQGKIETRIFMRMGYHRRSDVMAVEIKGQRYGRAGRLGTRSLAALEAGSGSQTGD